MSIFWLSGLKDKHEGILWLRESEIVRCELLINTVTQVSRINSCNVTEIEYMMDTRWKQRMSAYISRHIRHKRYGLWKQYYYLCMSIQQTNITVIFKPKGASYWIREGVQSIFNLTWLCDFHLYFFFALIGGIRLYIELLPYFDITALYKTDDMLKLLISLLIKQSGIGIIDVDTIQH